MTTNIVVPELGESVLEATVRTWLKQPGDRVAAGEALVELETEKVNLEVAATKAGVLARIDSPTGTDVKIGDVLGMIDETAAVGAPAPAAPPPAEKAAPAAEQSAPPTNGAAAPEAEPAPADPERVTPVARRLADEKGVDLAQVPATGAGGRVTKQDVQAFLAQQPAVAAPAPVAASQPEPAPAPPVTAPPSANAHREERVRLTRRRRTIARRLVEAQHTAAMLTTFNEIDLGAVMDIRARRKEAFKQQHGVGLGYTSFFVKASIGALKAFPRLNAEIQADEVVLKHYFDIGVAIGAEDGLVVPVLRDADQLTFAGIEQAVVAFVQKAQTNTLALEDLRGGTFTLTNGGVFGSMLSTPILNPPQVAILGLHKIEDRPIARQGAVVIRPMMYVALSYDHRIVDGREAVQFLVHLKQIIEYPDILLLES